MVTAEKAGGPIAGSKFLRWYCDRCKEPIRISKTRYAAALSAGIGECRLPIICDDCIGRGPRPPWEGLCDRQFNRLLEILDEEEVNVRLLEEA